ncbi:unnamed protein product, partial [marine sediment metagenome]
GSNLCYSNGTNCATYNATYDTGSNASWNETHADTLYTTTYNVSYAQNTTGWQGNFTDYSEFWYNMTNMSEDNASWNETYADTLYGSGGNASWNETHADDLYVDEIGDVMSGDLNLTAKITFLGNYYMRWMDNPGDTVEAYIYEQNSNLDFYIANAEANFTFNHDVDVTGDVCLDTGECLSNINTSWNETYAYTLFYNDSANLTTTTFNISSATIFADFFRVNQNITSLGNISAVNI